jgi:hypothetical protein
VQTAKAAAGKRPRKRQTGPADEAAIPIETHPQRQFLSGEPHGNPSDIEVLRNISYRNAVGFQLNEHPGKLRRLCGTAGQLQGQQKEPDRGSFRRPLCVGKDGRNTDTVNIDVSAERRWIIKPRIQHVAPLLDRDDELPTEIDVKSPIAVNTPRRSAAPRTTASCRASTAMPTPARKARPSCRSRPATSSPPTRTREATPGSPSTS